MIKRIEKYGVQSVIWKDVWNKVYRDDKNDVKKFCAELWI